MENHDFKYIFKVTHLQTGHVPGFQGYVGLPEGMGLSQSVQLLRPYEISPYTPKMTVKPVLNDSFCEGINDILVLFNILVGGFRHFLFSIIYGMSSFPLTFILFKMLKTTNQHMLFIGSGINH
jgi:hypothetical protein